jgi:hypothetical protein
MKDEASESIAKHFENLLANVLNFEPASKGFNFSNHQWDYFLISL